jgi:DNA replication regulator SLD3
MGDLIDFLKSLVMTTVVIDGKYREAIPDILSRMKTLVEDSDKGVAKSKKRTSKKTKLGKDGLYPGEDEHVRRWWSCRRSVASEEETGLTTQEIRYHISCLRRRETQIQMIVILEIMALEPLARPLENAADTQLPGMGSVVSNTEASSECSVKKRNKHSFPVLLDVLADRLCIWQSTLEEVKAHVECQVNSQGHDGGMTAGVGSDQLKDFCTDILVPL